MSEQDLNNFDNQLKSKLGSMKFDPPPSLKNKLAADFDAISAKRRRKRFIFWFTSGLSAILLISGGLGAYFYTTHNQQGVSNVDSIANAIIPSASAEIVEPRSENQITNDGTGNSDKSNSPANPETTTASFSSSDNNSGLSQINSENQSFNTINDDEQVAEINSEKEPSEAKASRNTTDQDPLPTKTVDPIINPAIVAGESLGSDNHESNNNQIASSERATSSTPTADEGSKGTDRIITNSFNNKTVTPSLAYMPTLQQRFNLNSSLADQSRKVAYKAPVALFQNSQNCLRPFVTIGGGTGLSYRVLKSDAHADLVEHKNQNEHSALSYSGQIAASIPLFKSYAIKSGFQYLRLAEAYHFAAANAEHQTVNTYDYLNLDLKLTKNLFCDGKFRVDLSAGAKAGMLLSAQSSWLDPNDHSPVLHSSAGQQNPFSEFALSWNAELAGYYTFGNNWLIGLGLEGDYFQNSVYIKQTGLVQRPYFFQGSLVFGKTF